MSIKTIKRTMYSGIDTDTGEHEFVLKSEHGDDTHLSPFAADLHNHCASPEKFDELLRFGAVMGNGLALAPWQFFAQRIEGHTVIWSDEITIDVPERLE